MARVDTRWCPKCAAHTLVGGQSCSFCGTDLGALPAPDPTPVPELQLPLMVTTLFHLTEPRGVTRHDD